MLSNDTDFSLYGDYRSVLVRPHNFQWRTVRHRTMNDSLVRTPMDDADFEPATDPDGPLRSLILDFSLGPSTYATMLYREVTRTSSSSSFQAYRSKKARADDADSADGDDEVASEDEVGKQLL